MQAFLFMIPASVFDFVEWSWRESNPRPNRETIRFLHAYPGLRFSCTSKTRATHLCLILLEFHLQREADANYLRFSCTTGPEYFGATVSE